MTVIYFIIALLMITAMIGEAFIFFDLTSDLKMYKSALKSSFENNAKLSKLCQDLIIEDKNFSVDIEKSTSELIESDRELQDITTKQNLYCEELIKDNEHLKAKLNEVLMHIDDGK